MNEDIHLLLGSLGSKLFFRHHGIFFRREVIILRRNDPDRVGAKRETRLEFGNRADILRKKRSLLQALYDEKFECQQETISILGASFDPKNIGMFVPKEDSVKWEQVLQKMKGIQEKIDQALRDIEKIQDEIDFAQKTTS